MGNYEEKVESMLKRYRPMGPPVELKIRIFDSKGNRWNRNWLTVAAGILLILGISVSWRLLSEPSKRPGVMDKEPTATEIELAANRAAQAAQMLAMAGLLSLQPGGEQYAVKRYNYVITSFPETEQSAKARLHLRSLSERRQKQ